MHPKFRAVAESAHLCFEKLIAMEPVVGGQLPHGMPTQGVYLFSEGSNHLYVGRSNSLRRRYRQHTRQSSQHNQAVFAFKLAREATGRQVPAYVPGSESRLGLSKNSEFSQIFDQSKLRIRNMDFRYVEETDQTRQAILELYSVNSPEFSRHPRFSLPAAVRTRQVTASRS